MNLPTVREVVVFRGSTCFVQRRPVPAWHHEFVKLYKAGLNDCQIGRKLGRSHNDIWRLRESLALPANAKRGRPRKVTE